MPEDHARVRKQDVEVAVLTERFDSHTQFEEERDRVMGERLEALEVKMDKVLEAWAEINGAIRFVKIIAAVAATMAGAWVWIISELKGLK